MAQRAPGLIAELVEVARAEVGQLLVFPVIQDVFREIELRA